MTQEIQESKSDSSSLNTTQKKAVALKFTQLETIELPSSAKRNDLREQQDEQSEEPKSALQGRYHHEILQDSANISEREDVENSGPPSKLT